MQKTVFLCFVFALALRGRLLYGAAYWRVLLYSFNFISCLSEQLEQSLVAHEMERADSEEGGTRGHDGRHLLHPRGVAAAD